MAAAASGSPYGLFQSKLTENISTLYAAIHEKLVGPFSTFQESAKDTEIKSLRDILAIFLNWKKIVQTGGARFGYANLNRHLKATKALSDAVSITSNFSMNISKVEFEGNEIVKSNLESQNAILLGGGPAGLYMAILLKIAIPGLNVLVLENRVNAETKLRILSRKRVFKFNNANFRKSDTEDDLQYDTLFELIKQAKLLPLLSIDEKNIDLFKNVIHLSEYPSVTINKAEFRLAAFAQQIGVKIHHVAYGKSAADVEEYLRTNFINNNLLAIFDATGGRIYDNFKDVPKLWKKPVMIDGEPIPVYEASVNPDIAVRIFPGTQIPFIGIGDSIVRANFVWGNGLAINGIIMLFYTLLFREYYEKYAIMGGNALEGGGMATRRARRHRNRTRRRARRVAGLKT